MVALELLKDKKPTDIDEVYKKYFIIFSHFVSNELCISLRMPTETIGEISSGRNITTIVMFYNAFQLMHCKNDDISALDKLLDKLLVHTSTYIDQVQTEDCAVDFNGMFDFDSVDTKRFNSLNSRFDDYFDSSQIHDDFEKARYKYLYDVRPNVLGCIQALIEFFNATSHLLACFSKDADKETIASNIEKANAHLTRGTLDNYKSVIKNGFEVMGSSLLECAKQFGETKPLSLVEIRRLEFDSLGRSLSAEERTMMFLGYKNICLEIVEILNKTEKKKRQQRPLTQRQSSIIKDLISSIPTIPSCALGNFIKQVKVWDITHEENFASYISLWTYIFVVVADSQKGKVVDLSVALSLPVDRQERYKGFKQMHIKPPRETEREDYLSSLIKSMKQDSENFLIDCD